MEDCFHGENWPDAGQWVSAPETVLRDIEILRAGFCELPLRQTLASDIDTRIWIQSCRQFAGRLRAAQILCSLPVSAEQLFRAATILETLDAVETVEVTELVGRREWTTRQQSSRMSPDQRRDLVGEAHQILDSELSVADEFFLLRRQQSEHNQTQAEQHQPKSKSDGNSKTMDPIEIALLQSPRLLARYRHLKSLSYPAMLESTADLDGLWNKPPEERDDSYLRRGWKELQNAINKIEGASAEVSLPGLTVQLVRHDIQHG